MFLDQDSENKQMLKTAVLKLLSNDALYEKGGSVLFGGLLCKINKTTHEFDTISFDVKYGERGYKAYCPLSLDWQLLRNNGIDPLGVFKPSDVITIVITVGNNQFYIEKHYPDRKKVKSILRINKDQIAPNCTSWVNKTFFKKDYLYDYEIEQTEYKSDYRIVFKSDDVNIDTDLTEEQFNILNELYNKKVFELEYRDNEKKTKGALDFLKFIIEFSELKLGKQK